MIAFSPEISRDGEYRFELVVDGRASTCELDFDPSRRQSLPESCAGLWISGSDVPAPAGGVSEGPPYRILSWSAPPALDIQISVLRDGVPWGSGHFAPVYRRVHRHDSCGKSLFAREQLALP